jgi:hypothetical protein
MARAAGQYYPLLMRTDAERLRLFCELVTKARNRRAITGPTLEAGFTLHFGRYEGPAVETQLGDEDDARSLMADLRKFLAPGEDVYFDRIANIVERAVTDEEMRDASRRNRENWKIVRTEGLVRSEPHNRTPETWFDLIVNGEVFHDDAAKRAEFESLSEDLQAIGRATVNAMLFRMLQVLWPERNLITAGLERGAFRFPPPTPGLS